MTLRLTFLLPASVFFTGCATLLSGPTETIHVDSDPAGASFAATCGSTTYRGETPDDVPISRRAGTCDLEISKLGFKTVHVTLESGLNQKILGNLLPFGLTLAGTLIAGETSYGGLAVLGGTILIGGGGFLVDWVSGRRRSRS